MTAVLSGPVTQEPRHRKDSAAHAPPRWTRPAVFGLLAATAVLYFWNLTASGYGNSFYAAAVQSGTQDWKAWLFGSLDSGNVLTVDKPPAALWVATAFARIFGFSSFTVLAPQALMGVASVGILYLTVKRTSGPIAGLMAGAMLARDAGGGADVPVQQPGRAARAADGRRRLLRRAGHGKGQPQVARAGRCRDRVRLPDEDDAGVPGAAGVRAGVPDRGADVARQAAAAPRRRGRGAGRLGGLVRRAGRPVADGVTALHRRVRREQPARTRVGLQRLVAHLRRRRRRRPGRWRRHGRRREHRLRRRVRAVPDVRVELRHGDLVAAAGRADRAGRRAVVHPPRAAHRPDAPGAGAVGRLAGRHGAGVQLHERHRAPVLLGRARPGDRRAGRDFGPRAVAGPGQPGPAGDAGRDGRGDGGVVVHPARPDAGLVPGAALDRRGARRPRRDGAGDGRADASARRPRSWRRRWS